MTMGKTTSVFSQKKMTEARRAEVANLEIELLGFFQGIISWDFTRNFSWDFTKKFSWDFFRDFSRDFFQEF